MIVLDTDHVTALRYREHPRWQTLMEHLRSLGEEQVTISIVTLEEQMRGWLAQLKRCRDARSQIPTCERLANLFRFFADWEILVLTDRAVDEFERLRKQRVRIGTPDLKIAAIALAHDALLLSANLRDFRQVPGLRIENWLK
jgi:tRNA(fMet)-specific endonuclease VapC